MELPTQVATVAQVIQLAVAPVFLLAGIGLSGLIHTHRNLLGLVVRAGRADLHLHAHRPGPGVPPWPGPAALDIGIPADQLNAITDGLSRLLADTYTLYLKTHNYHWNVTGPQFNDLHKFLQSQYEELDDFVDDVAERAGTALAASIWPRGTRSASTGCPRCAASSGRGSIRTTAR